MQGKVIWCIHGGKGGGYTRGVTPGVVIQGGYTVSYYYLQLCNKHSHSHMGQTQHGTDPAWDRPSMGQTQHSPRLGQTQHSPKHKSYRETDWVFLSWKLDIMIIHM